MEKQMNIQAVKTQAKSNGKNHKQKGISLIEIMIGLGILSVVALGVYSVYGTVKTSSENQAELKNIQSITAKVRSMFAGRNNYTGLSESMVRNANGIPTAMVSGTNIYHSWNTDASVTIAPVVANPTTFTITYPGVPTANCIELVNTLQSSMQAISVGGTAVGTTVGTNDANTLCSVTDAPNIVFTSR